MRITAIHISIAFSIALQSVLALEVNGEPRSQSRGELLKTERAADCDLSADHYVFGADQARQVFLRHQSDVDRAVLLTSYERNAEVIFAPGCRMIALNDNLGSNVAEVRLFRRVDGLVYKEEQTDIADRAWTALERASGLKRRLRLGHTYVNAIVWSTDSRSILLRLWGHTDDRNEVGGWYCVYEVDTGRISTDLSLMNRGSVVMNGRSR